MTYSNPKGFVEGLKALTEILLHMADAWREGVTNLLKRVL